MQIYATLLYIEFIKDTVIADSQFELRTAFESFMGKT